MRIVHVIFLMGITLSLSACKKYPIEPGNDPNFTVVANTDQEFKKFPKKVEVFGIPIYAAKKVETEKMLHAANILAQYLDNDEDGNIDNSAVVQKLIDSKAFLFMWKKKTDRWKAPNSDSGQDLGADETVPAWHSNGKTGRFDASLEEVFHLITHVGYAKVYPQVFGEGQGTSISNAMDIARGGQFTSIPNNYPDNAWYTYTDKTCNYDCQTTEYIYWAMTSMLGAQETRYDEISHEWKLNTPTLMETQDVVAFQLLSDPQYKFPTVLPDGTYRH